MTILIESVLRASTLNVATQSTPLIFSTTHVELNMKSEQGLGEDLLNRAKLFQRIIDFLFGYDFFISYAWDDGRAYAVKLAEKLRSEGFICFLDTQEFRRGLDWRIEGLRALRKTSRMLLVGSPAALKSEPVLYEYRNFKNRESFVVPIDFENTLRLTDSSSSELLKELSASILRIPESFERLSIGPSDETITDIRKGFEFTRQQQWRLRWITIAAVAFALIALVSTVASVIAVRRSKEVMSRGLSAQASLESGRQLDLALMLAVTAGEVQTTTQSNAALLETLNKSPISFFLYNDGIPIEAVAMNPTFPNLLTAVDSKGKVAIWDLTTRNQKAVMEAGKSFLHGLAISPNGSWMATGGQEKILTIWKVSSNDPVLTMAKALPNVRPAIIRNLLFIDDDNLLVASDDPTLAIYNLPQGTWNILPPVHRFAVQAMIKVPESAFIVTGSSDGRAVVWTADEAGFGPFKILNVNQNITSIAASDSGETLLFGTWERELQLWNLSTANCFAMLGKNFNSNNSRAIGDGSPKLHTASFPSCPPVTSLPRDVHVEFRNVSQ